jgi:hypothetical protein
MGSEVFMNPNFMFADDNPQLFNQIQTFSLNVIGLTLLRLSQDKEPAAELLLKLQVGLEALSHLKPTKYLFCEGKLGGSLELLVRSTVKHSILEPAQQLLEEWKDELGAEDEENVQLHQIAGCVPPKGYQFAPKNHPIYGEMGIMRRILFSRIDRVSYVVSPGFNLPSNVYGHNGLQIGDWFPIWIAALAGGAHGSIQSGIYDGKCGAYSAVVSSGLYDGFDRDLGETIYYSGSRSRDNRSSKPAATRGNISLLKSIETENPVRILRSGRGNSSNALSPRYGIRYDGLYRVTDYTIKTNKKGGAWYLFTLVRHPNQPKIDTKRPTPEETRDYHQVHRGY